MKPIHNGHLSKSKMPKVANNPKFRKMKPIHNAMSQCLGF